MKRPAKAKTADRIQEVRVAVKIHQSATRGKPLFTIAYRDRNNRRVKRSFADLQEAKAEAHAAAAQILKKPRLAALDPDTAPALVPIQTETMLL